VEIDIVRRTNKKEKTANPRGDANLICKDSKAILLGRHHCPAAPIEPMRNTVAVSVRATCGNRQACDNPILRRDPQNLILEEPSLHARLCGKKPRRFHNVMSASADNTVHDPLTQTRSESANDYIAELYFKQSMNLLKRCAFAEAELYLREVVARWPHHAGALNNLGTAVWQQARVQEAEEYYRVALARDPNDFAVLNNLGNALWEQTRPEQAVEFYRRALELQPDSIETQMNYGVALSDLGEFDAALDWLGTSLRR